jgi:hypothetical protein
MKGVLTWSSEPDWILGDMQCPHVASSGFPESGTVLGLE